MISHMLVMLILYVFPVIWIRQIFPFKMILFLKMRWNFLAEKYNFAMTVIFILRSIYILH